MRQANSTGLDWEIRSCTRCAALLAAHPENPPTAMRSVVPRPVLSPPMRAPLMLVGQAPGLTEYTTGSPFSGQAGHAIRQLFSSCGVPFMDFDRLVYQTSAVKCFPAGGRTANAGKTRRRDDKVAPLLRLLGAPDRRNSAKNYYRAWQRRHESARHASRTPKPALKRCCRNDGTLGRDRHRLPCPYIRRKLLFERQKQQAKTGTR